MSGSELGSIEQWVRICAQDHQCPVQMRKGHAGRCQRPSSLHMYIVWKAYVETEMRVREREEREREVGVRVEGEIDTDGEIER